MVQQLDYSLSEYEKRLLTEYNYAINKKINPSELELPVDNWRNTPKKDIPRLTKSISRVGLLHPPIVALYMKPKGKYKGIVLDGNRRVYACQQLEKGYTTIIDHVKVTLNLPDNWRIVVIDEFAENLKQEDVDRIRLHSTEEHRHFTLSEIKTQIYKTAREYCNKRGLTIEKVRANRTLRDEMLKYLANYYYIDKLEVSKTIQEIQKAHEFAAEVQEALHFNKISLKDAYYLSGGDVPDERRNKLVQKVIEKRENGYTDAQIIPALQYAKETHKQKEKDITEIFGQKIKTIPLTKKLTLTISMELFEKITAHKVKTNSKLDDVIVPILEEYYENWGSGDV